MWLFIVFTGEDYIIFDDYDEAVADEWEELMAVKVPVALGQMLIGTQQAFIGVQFWCQMRVQEMKKQLAMEEAAAVEEGDIEPPTDEQIQAFIDGETGGGHE